MKHFNFYKSMRERGRSPLLLKLCMLIAMMVVGINGAQAQEGYDEIFSVTLPQDMNAGTASLGYVDKVNGANQSLAWSGFGLDDDSQKPKNKVHDYDGQKYYYLDDNGEIKITFDDGLIQDGDVIEVTLGVVMNEVNPDKVGYQVVGSDGKAVYCEERRHEKENPGTNAHDIKLRHKIVASRDIFLSPDASSWDFIYKNTILIKRAGDKTCYYQFRVLRPKKYTVTLKANDNGELGSGYFTYKDQRYNHGQSAQVPYDEQIQLHGTLNKGYQATHLLTWGVTGGAYYYNINDTHTVKGTTDIDLNIDEGVRVIASVVKGSSVSPSVVHIAQPNGEGNPDWNRGNSALVSNGTNEKFVADNVSGYTFKGWYDKAEGGTLVSEDLEYNYGSVNPINDGQGGQIREIGRYAKYEHEDTKEWVFTFPGQYQTIYYTDGTTAWTSENSSRRYATEENILDGGYTKACKSGGELWPQTDNFSFSAGVKWNNTNEIWLYEDKKAKMKIEKVKAGDAYILHIKCGGVRTINISNCTGLGVDGSGNIKIGTDYKDVLVVAKAGGVIEISNPNNQRLYIDYVVKTREADFSFVDCEPGAIVNGTNGAEGYINAVKPGAWTPAGATYTWSTPNTDLIDVNSSTGSVKIKKDFDGWAEVRCTMHATGYPDVTRSYFIEVPKTQPYFVNTEVRDEAMDTKNSSERPLQDVKGMPSYGTVIYSIQSTTVGNRIPGVDAYITTDPDNPEDLSKRKVVIMGVGTTVVRARCGASYAEYTIITTGFTFANTMPVYNFTGSYSQNLVDGATASSWRIAEKYGQIERSTTVTINTITGEVTGLPTDIADEKGGAIVVEATNGSQKTYYTLTIPYYHHVWNFYEAGEDASKSRDKVDLSSDGNCLTGDKAFITGALVNKTNPHSAVYSVPLTETELVGGEDGADPIPAGTYDMYNLTTYGGTESKLTDAMKEDLRRRQLWKRRQAELTGSDADKAQPEYYWNYNFKTIERLRDSKGRFRVINYTNEPLFTYKNSVNGDNARVITNTAGLQFRCAADHFGMNDNEEGGCSQDVQEQDRCVAVKAGSSFTIPYVKAGEYVKLYWYRHSDNNGDRFRVTNATDLDGYDINPNHELRFTGTHYYDTDSKYRGCTFLRAKADGPITITFVNGWTELQRIETTADFKTDLRVRVARLDEITMPETITEPSGYDSEKPLEQWSDEEKAYKAYLDAVADYNAVQGWGGHLTHDYGKEGANVDLNDRVLSVVRNASDDTEIEESDIVESGFYDKKRKIHTDVLAKKASKPEGTQPIIYISGYPGQTYSWNAWNVDVEVKAEAEDASKLDFDVKNTFAHVGKNNVYRFVAVYNFDGTGAAHVIIRTKSNPESDRAASSFGNDKAATGVYGEGNLRYTLDVQEAYFPVGEYQEQTYPYTWDFTEENFAADMSKHNTYLNRGVGYNTQTRMNSNSSNPSHYGSWTNASSGSKTILRTYKEMPPTVPTVDKDKEDDEKTNKTYNAWRKYLYADGSQLTVSAGSGAEYIAEAEGLRFRFLESATPTWLEYKGIMDHGRNGDGGLIWKYPGDETYINMPSTTTVTIPQVDKGMYVFVKAKSGSTQPKFAVDITNLEWVTNGQGCTEAFGEGKNTIFGTDAGGTNLSYVDITDYDEIRIYGKSGDWVRAFVNREEYNSNYEISKQITDGVAIISKAEIRAKQGEPQYIHLNGIKAGPYYYSRVTVNKIQVVTNGSANLGDEDVIKSEEDNFGAYQQNPVTATFRKDDLQPDVYVYHVNNLRTDVKADVDLLCSNIKLEKIGVTDEFKMMTNLTGWATESRLLRMNYDYSGEFTKNALKASIVHTPVKNNNCGHVENGQPCQWCGSLTLTRVHKVKGWKNFRNNGAAVYKGSPEYAGEGIYVNADVVNHPARGLVVKEYAFDTDEDKINDDEPEKRNLIPLFVPANNQLYDDISSNILVDVVNEGGNIPASTSTKQIYILTNKYYDWNDWNGGTLTNGKPVKMNFYIIRPGGDGPSRKNSAYLKLNNSQYQASLSNIRNFYLFEGESPEASGIDEIETDDSKEISEMIQAGAEVYTLSGVKLNGLPTAKGVYIINGKKMLVK